MPRLLIFKVGPHRCGVDSNLVAGIANSDRQLDQLPEAQYRYEIQIEGTEQPVYNLPQLFNRTCASGENGFSKIVRMKVGGQRIGFIVGQVLGDMDFEKQALKFLPPIFNGSMRKCFPEILSHEGEPIMVADPEALVRLADNMQASLPFTPLTQVRSDMKADEQSKSITLAPNTDNESESMRLRTVQEVGPVDTDRGQVSPVIDKLEGDPVGEIKEIHGIEQRIHAINAEFAFPIGWDRVENGLQKLLAVKLGKLLGSAASDSTLEFPDGYETFEKPLQRLVTLKMRYLLSRVLEETA